MRENKYKRCIEEHIYNMIIISLLYYMFIGVQNLGLKGSVLILYTSVIVDVGMSLLQYVYRRVRGVK